MIFTQKWIEDAVRKVLNCKDEVIADKDIERIKYLRVGETFDNQFFIQISLENPPLPFASASGGDEWAFCCIRGDNLESFIDKTIEKEKNSTDIQLSLGSSDYKDKEMQQYAYSDKARRAWNTFKESIISNTYYEEFEDDTAYDVWYEQNQINIAKDIVYFKGVQVLRINGLVFDGFNIFKELSELKVLELVETNFHSVGEIEELKKLEQLCCWLD